MKQKDAKEELNKWFRDVSGDNNPERKREVLLKRKQAEEDDRDEPKGLGFSNITNITGIVIMLVVVGVMLVVGMGVMDNLNEVTNGYNATSTTVSSLSNVTNSQGLLGTIIIFGVIISVVIVAFAVGSKGF